MGWPEYGKGHDIGVRLSSDGRLSLDPAVHLDLVGFGVVVDATTGVATITPPNRTLLSPTAAIAETVSRVGNGADLTTASGTLHMAAIPLKAGMLIHNINFVLSGTALTRGTNAHLWFALYDANFNLLARTADDTAATWGAYGNRTGALTAPYTVPTTGLYFLGVMVVAGGGGVQPVLACLSFTASDLKPYLCGTSTASLTTTPPATAGTLTPDYKLPYAFVS